MISSLYHHYIIIISSSYHHHKIIISSSYNHHIIIISSSCHHHIIIRSSSKHILPGSAPQPLKLEAAGCSQATTLSGQRSIDQRFGRSLPASLSPSVHLASEVPPPSPISVPTGTLGVLFALIASPKSLLSVDGRQMLFGLAPKITGPLLKSPYHSEREEKIITL